MCVCVYVALKRQYYAECSCACFQRTVYARWQCVVFFREQLIFLVPFKGISFCTAGILTSACVNSFIPPHGFMSIDELKSTGIVFHPSKTLIEVQVVISVIPGTKVVVHGITGNSLHNHW